MMPASDSTGCGGGFGVAMRLTHHIASTTSVRRAFRPYHATRQAVGFQTLRIR
jgi:hypothetical protein